MAVEWTGNISRNLHLALNPPAGDQSRIEAGQNISQWQTDEYPVPIIFGRKNFRNGLTQFPKGDLHCSARELREDFLQRHSDR